MAGENASAAAAPRTRDADDSSINRLVKLVLQVGLSLGAILLLAGFVLWALGGKSLPASLAGPAAAVRSIGRLEPNGFFSLGLLAIILTPFVRVAGTVVVFMRGREWAYVAVTATVLLSMIAGILVGAL